MLWRSSQNQQFSSFSASRAECLIAPPTPSISDFSECIDLYDRCTSKDTVFKSWKISMSTSESEHVHTPRCDVLCPKCVQTNIIISANAFSAATLGTSCRGAWIVCCGFVKAAGGRTSSIWVKLIDFLDLLLMFFDIFSFRARPTSGCSFNSSEVVRGD